MSHIPSVGVELEGKWTKERGIPLPKTKHGALAKPHTRGKPRSLKVDTSVRMNSRSPLTRDTNNNWTGEVASPVLTNGRAVGRWMRAWYPDYVNPTCGIHVHIGFRNESDFYRVVRRTFHNYILDKMTAWGEENSVKDIEFWGRLKGLNTYCKKEWKGFNQIRSFAESSHVTGGEYTADRYTQLNYCAWDKFKTLEFRFLPAFKCNSVAISSVYCLINAVNAYMAGKASFINHIEEFGSIDMEPEVGDSSEELEVGNIEVIESEELCVT